MTKTQQTTLNVAPSTLRTLAKTLTSINLTNKQAGAGRNDKKSKGKGGKKSTKGKKSPARKPSFRVPGVPKIPSLQTIVSRDIAQERHNLERSEVMNIKSEMLESIPVNINPYCLYQYVFGFLSSVVSKSDNAADNVFVRGMAVYYVQCMPSIPSPEGFTLVTTWPRVLLRLAYSLRARRIGKYSYVPRWDWVNSMTSAIGAGGFTVSTAGFDYYAPVSLTSTTTGYLTDPLNIPSSAVPYPDEPEVVAFHAKFGSQLDLVGIVEGAALDCKDASAFAYDVSSPLTVSDGSTSPVFFAGRSASQQFLRCNGSVGCETRIRNPHLASIRLGTQVANDIIMTPAITRPTTRVPKFVLSVTNAPGTMGFLANNRQISPKGTQLKIVPASSLLLNIVGRINALGATALGGTDWTTRFGPNDIPVLAYLLWKRQMRNYAGSEVGTYFLNPGVISPPEPLNLHMGTSQLAALRIPQPIDDLLSSVRECTIGKGSILPWAAMIDLSGITNTSSDYIQTYTGAGVFGPFLPQTNVYNITNNRSPVASLVPSWKGAEVIASKYCNLTAPSVRGESYLDCSILVTSTTSGILGIASRRVITDNEMSNVLLRLPAVGYAITDSARTLTMYDSSQEMNYAHLYGMRYRKDFDGFLTPAAMRINSVFDGYVSAGTLTSNSSANRGPDFNQGSDWGVLQALKAAVPTHGKYCGPGYSAGERGSNQLMVDGKYVVPPDDEYDAICKRHDEYYDRADKHPSPSVRRDMKIEADQEMARELNSLENLPLHGRLAKGAFLAKGAVDRANRAGFSDARREL